MANNIRPHRIGEQMKVELAALIRDEMKDPRVGFVSIVKVEVSPDMSTAKVFISVLGDEQAKKNSIKGLESAMGFLRSELSQRMRLRQVPALRFVLDESIEHGARIAALLHQINKGPEGGPGHG